MLLNTYNRLPIQFTHGQGCWLYDDKGQRYLDLISGVAVCNLGHAHPDITRTIVDQAGKLLHTSNLVRIPEQEALAERLQDLAKLHGAFFINSGSEANETAIKVARKWGVEHGREQPTILCFRRAFHGRTLAMLAATNNPAHISGFAPLPDGFAQSPLNDIQETERIIQANPNICALFIEPVMSEAGVLVHEESYLLQLQDLAQRNDCLFILDEVQTGAGRTGQYFSYREFPDLKPDIISLAKGMGNGMPIGACLVNQDLLQIMQPGSHGSTFGGNQLACRVALTLIDVLERDNLYQNTKEMGAYILDRLVQRIGDHPRIERIQGRGLMIAIELRAPAPFNIPLKALQSHQVLLNLTQEKIIRLLPPLIIDSSQADQAVEAVSALVEQDNLYQEKVEVSEQKPHQYG